MPPAASPDIEDDSSSECSELPASICEDDRCNAPELPVWHCVDCDSSYCDDCWPRQGPHKPKKKGRDGVPHEKTNPAVVSRLKAILNPTRKPEEIQRMHEDDESTKWFGVARDLTGRPNFEDYGRYASLMSSISPIESMQNRYPQLVSFIGITNAGKSTLIKMLVNHDQHNSHPDRAALFPSPIVGSVVNDTLPTSGDVHLYADPATHAEQLPILFADCEGFEGGERVPLGARSRMRRDGHAGPDRAHVHSRPIEWANTEESKQREFAVTALYPRLLYTFSDCVVFVLRNPKTFQSAVLAKLLEWGVAALEKSINQPALPHCVVAVNGTDPSVDDKEWDISFATQSLLASVHGALDYVEGVPRFRELAEHWRSLGKHIYSVEDLILRYYSSFKVIRIPSKPRYMTINEQIGKLHSVIRNNCEESFRAKRRARMLTNADELNVYLQSGFDHFTTHLDVPFNFMQISLLRNPIPNDFGGHILQLCTTLSSQQPNHQPGRVAWMFEKLSVMLSSCVLLDCARFRKGRVDELFANYEKFFDYAMGEYLELHYPCSYVSADGTRQCMLVKARHQPKGHQDEKGIIAAGDYEAAFDSTFLQQWKAQLRSAIEGIHRDFSYELEQASNEDVQAIPEERIALDLHMEYLNQFYEAVGPAAAICSHATCFCCLMDVPEHPLPCGHVLCNACIKAYGKTAKATITLLCCPLHRESTKWAKPALVKFKPANAGVRVLSLDGGGVRGIVQLEVLRAIEQAMGGYIPVQSFFDLIVGTGTGGLLGVAMSMKDRSIESCIDMFSALCDHAFTPKLKGIPVISHLAQVLGSGPKYKTKPLYAALKTAFTEEEELFGSSERLKPGARVALTATSVTGRESILLASYRRPEDFLPAYQFERPHEPEMELKIWQSVAAALATPSYFRPFNYHAKTYLDGGVRCANPAFIADRERRLIWPDVGEPDLFLSLGTGQNRITVLQKLSERPRDSAGEIIPPEPGQVPKMAGSRWRTRRVDDVLDAELAWADFRAYAIRGSSEAKGRRFIRFNPDLDREPPQGDHKNDMEALQVNVRKRLQTPHRLAALRNVANRLIASSFYLDLQSKATAEKSEQVCSGVLACRFEDGSKEMSALGKILAEARTDDFQPYFSVRPDAARTDYVLKIPITYHVIRTMIEHAVFGLPNLHIPLRDESKPTAITLFLSPHDGLEPDGFPVSGFPRILLGESTGSAGDRTSRRPGPKRVTSAMTTRNTLPRKKSDTDSLSLNENGRPDSRADSSARDSEEAQSRSSLAYTSGSPKMSLSDLIAQHQQVGGTSVRQRTNRFWTYIGNNHMAQHPEMYTDEELAKFAATNGLQPAELAAFTSENQAAPPYSSPNLSRSTLTLSPKQSYQQVHELESTDVITTELYDSLVEKPSARDLPPHPSTKAGPLSRHSISEDRQRPQTTDSLPSSPSSKNDSHHQSLPLLSSRDTPHATSPHLREPVVSVVETEFEEEGDQFDDETGSVYSGNEVQVARASPVVQVPQSFSVSATKHQQEQRQRPLIAPAASHHRHKSSEGYTALPPMPSHQTPDSARAALDKWLQAQRSRTPNSSTRRADRLKSVHEESE